MLVVVRAAAADARAALAPTGEARAAADPGDEELAAAFAEGRAARSEAGFALADAAAADGRRTRGDGGGGGRPSRSRTCPGHG